MDAPNTLGEAGTALWSSIASKYALRPDELVILERSCRAADRLALVETEWIAQGRPFLTKGSMGQDVTHPLFSEQQKLEAHLKMLLVQLKLPDEGASSDSSTAARKAASARWSHGA